MPRPRASFTAALIALALTGGGEESEPSTESASTATPTPTGTAAASPAGGAVTVAGVEVGNAKDLDSEPTVTIREGAEPPTELVSRDLVTGKGARLRSGDEVSVRYTGVSWSTGEKFDASWDRGTEPFTFPLGAAQVIPGWDEGVAGMRAGGRAC